MNTYLKAYVLICTLIASNKVFAEDDLFFEIPIVLSASRLEQPISEAPVAITNIDRQMIEASGARNIPDVLRLVPGMQVGYSSNEFGDEPKFVVTYHGHSDQYSKRMQVLIDGRSIYEPLLGGVDWNTLPINLDDIERIEVTRGPNASTYGSNSFLAVVNIITRHATEDAGHYVRVNLGNHDIFDSIYRFGGHNENIDYRVSVSTQNDDGQDRANNGFTHDDSNTDAIDYRMDYQIDANNQITYQGGYRQNTTQAQGNIRDGYRTDREVGNTLAHQFIKWEKNIDSDESIVVQYYFNLHDKNDNSLTSPIPLTPFDPVILEYNADLTSKRHNFEFTHILEPTDHLKILWGLSQQYDEAKSVFWLNRDDYVTRDLSRVFSNAEWKLSDNNTLNIGLLLEKNETTGSSSSPRIALIHHLSQKHSLRIGISQSVRIPFLVEDYGSTQFSAVPELMGVPQAFTLMDQQLLGSDQLTPERITSREIGYYGRFLNDDLFINARLFHDTVRDLIDVPNLPVNASLDNVDGIAQIFTNANNTIISGIEAEFDYYFDKTLRIIGNASFIDIDSNDLIDGATRELTESAPDKSATLLVMKKFSHKYSGSMGVYYVSDFAWLDANPGTISTIGVRNTGGYRKLDLRFSRLFKSGDEKINASIILQNISEDFSDYDAQPAPGSEQIQQNFSVFIEIKVQFK